MILVIDVQGGIQVREKLPSARLIFVQAPGLDVLKQRLRARGTDDEASIQRRLATPGELELAILRVHLVNGDLERSVDELAAILVQNHCQRTP